MSCTGRLWQHGLGAADCMPRVWQLAQNFGIAMFCTQLQKLSCNPFTNDWDVAGCTWHPTAVMGWDTIPSMGWKQSMWHEVRRLHRGVMCLLAGLLCLNATLRSDWHSQPLLFAGCARLRVPEGFAAPQHSTADGGAAPTPLHLQLRIWHRKEWDTALKVGQQSLRHKGTAVGPDSPQGIVTRPHTHLTPS